ncbi:phosphoglucomutase/phosphomannomutase family protein [Salinarchaeum laminariae]|uniref:phosphoglucomutase/phosphomannomutase family protein n=1 Tax=Salinarchaeum laminariae TaxID=869888 RepID=UPI0020BE5C6D|nr:phosphoglucomutase/phosphomannomutase family protein [Salinarchaeum laminariae]
MDEISFGTDGWRAHSDLVTPERLHAIAQSVVDLLAEDGFAGEPLVVGYDARDGARDRAEEIARVLAAGGHDVLLADRDCPTPAVALAIVQRDLAGGFVVTASHNPPEYSGVKFIPHDGAPALPTITNRIEDGLGEPDPLPDEEHGEIEEVDLIEAQIGAVLDLVDPDLDGLTVAYDAIYGSGRGVTDEALERAGADVVRLRCGRDPTFGGGEPNPEPEMLEELSELVAAGNADLGIANDGDADRVAIVTADGFLDANELLAACYEYLLQSDSGPIVRTVSTSSLVDRIADDHGTSVAETPVGFKWVAQAMAEEDALIGGEESGGLSIRGHVREKDGTLAALLAAAAHAEEPLQERIARLRETYGDLRQDRVSVDCPDDNKGPVMADLEGAIPEQIAGSAVESMNPADGVKCMLADGTWLLVRPSGTEPKLRIYAEAETDQRIDELLAAGRGIVEPLL